MDRVRFWGPIAAMVCVVGLIIGFAVSFATADPEVFEDFLPTAGPEDPEPLVTSEPGRADSEWVLTVSVSAGIPAIALQAYGDATLQIEQEQPGCNLGWTTIAAIGYVETAHGTHGGAQLLADGRTSERILGPALNGTSGTDRVPATAETSEWHGDPKWDHAVGPMQFIPSSWHTWGADGDGDGIADPNDIDDAALTTARYLCASGADLRTPGGWSRAIFSYNHSDDYVRSILTTANAYADRAGAAA